MDELVKSEMKLINNTFIKNSYDLKQKELYIKARLIEAKAVNDKSSYLACKEILKQINSNK